VSGPAHHLNVVAGENFWGSIAAQLGGSHVDVTSVVSNPNADPHEYESSSADARVFAGADYVILNGAGYDAWGDKLLAANPARRRRVLAVGALLGKRDGDNPHFWYSPEYVEHVADRITHDYQLLDPADAQAFAVLRDGLAHSLAPYHERIASIRRAFRNVKVAATEDIFVYLASALGLDLVSPTAFMQAVAEGNDPPADAVARFQDQIAAHEPAVLVYNTQTVTPITTSLRQEALDRGIPVVGISETMQPVTSTFEAWQTGQLVALETALRSSRH
jgi:zinc/manganese transport system substrate-binding protein